ncbi:hypothetical protein Fot_20334 [Forsythia ovata]|uniref:Uncharacterized protein n=1 Tax=Forsythia ovata TaxID=205694 RepID=A0ABD1VQA1_9LAMI
MGSVPGQTNNTKALALAFTTATETTGDDTWFANSAASHVTMDAQNLQQGVEYIELEPTNNFSDDQGKERAQLLTENRSDSISADNGLHGGIDNLLGDSFHHERGSMLKAHNLDGEYEEQ